MVLTHHGIAYRSILSYYLPLPIVEGFWGIFELFMLD